MSEKIVVGITAAPVMTRVIAWVRERAADTGAEVELVTIVGGATGAVGEGGVLEMAVVGAQTVADGHAETLRDSGVPVTVRVERGDPVAVLSTASATADLLVIGSDHHGDGGPARGAHGIRITAAAECAAVVVPDIDVDARTGVLVGTDGSSVSENAVRFAAAEAARRGETLTAVSVWTPMPIPGPLSGYPEPYLDDMQGVTAEILRTALEEVRTAHPDLEIVERVECGYPSTILAELAAEASLVVVGSHGRGAFTRLLLGSISHEVLARLATVTAIVR